MPSTYTTNLGIEKIGTGEQSGTWGDTTNTNFDLIDQAINGIGSVNVSTTDTANPTQIQITDGSISNGRDAFIEFTSLADLGASGAVQLTPNDAEKIVHVRNSLQGSQSLIIFQGAYNASNDYVVPNGADVLLKFSGTGSGSTVTPVQLSPKFDGTMRVEDVVVSGSGSVDFSQPNAQLILRTNQISGNVIDGGVISNFASTGIEDAASSTSLFIDSSGNITVTGTVDGRDIAADGSKLDGIEPGAEVNVGTNLGRSVSGTGFTLTSSTGNNTTLPAATTSAWGVMTDEDKTKLDGIAPNAEVNVDTNISVTENVSTVTINSSTGTGDSIAAATGSLAGVMTATDKAKLDASTSSSTASTLVERDSSRDINVRLLRTDFADQGTLSGAIAFRVNNSNDNYTRYCNSPSSARSWLGVDPAGTVNYTLPQATSTTRGGVELGSDTVQSVAANTVSATAGKTYAVQLNSANQMVVNVPWSDSTNPGTITGVTAGTGLSGGGTSGTVTLNLDFSELTDMTADISGTTEFILQNGTTESRKAASEIKLSNFNNDAGWTSNVGDITGVTAGVGLSGGGNSGSVTLTLDMSELTDMTATMVGTDEFIVLDAGADRRKAANEIGLSIFNNDSGFTTNVGDITGVTAGSGLTGGGSSGSVTLNVGAGALIDVSADAVAVDLSELTDMTATMVSTDEFVVLDASAQRRKAASEIGLSIFNNDAGFTTNVGDITGVTASNGLYGGGTSGTVTVKKYNTMNVGGTVTMGDGGFRSVNSSGQTITLPASPAQGDTVYISVGKFTDTVIARNGSNISGLAEDMTVDVADIGLTLIYSGNSTQGWRIF